MSLDKARILISQRQFQDAIQVLKEHLESTPDDQEAQALIGDAQERMMLQMQINGKLKKVEEQIQSGELDGAQNVLAGVLAIDPDNPQASGLMDQIAQARTGGAEAPDATMVMSAVPELEPALEPAPLEPAPLEPPPVEPAPMDADATMMMPPVDVSGTAPQPMLSDPLEPAPLEPAPLEPAPLEPAALEPAPLEPAPLEPAPLEPAGLEPAPLEPAPMDADATMMMPPVGGMEPLAPMEPLSPTPGTGENTPPAMEPMAPMEAMEALPSLEAVEAAPLETAAPPTDDLIPLEPVSADSGAAPDLSHLDPAEAQRVMQYLEEGQKALDRGDASEAVDIWTRIFILDDDNVEAQRRIDLAQAQGQGGGEDQEMLLASGIAAFNDGNFDQAELHFQNLLSANPSHPQAQEYLSQVASKRAELETGIPGPVTDLPDLEDDMPVDVAGQPRADLGLPQAPASAPADDIAPPPAPLGEPGDDMDQGPLITPTKTKSRGPLIMIAVIGMVVVVGVGGFMGWKMFFAKEKPKPISQAPDMEIPPPIDEKPVDPKPANGNQGNTTETPTEDPETVVSSALPIGELLDIAKKAIDDQNYSQSMEAAKAIMDQDPLHDQARLYYKEASENKKAKDALLKKYGQIRSKYNQGETDQALREAWTLYSPLNIDDRQPLIKYNMVEQVTTILRVGHYNKALRFLRNNRPDTAAKELEPLLTLGIDDAMQRELSDLHNFCKSYEGSFGSSPEYAQAVDRLQEKNI